MSSILVFNYGQEEQRVIDAQIRMRRREIQDEEERMQRRQDMSSSSRIIEGDDEIVSIGNSGITNPSGSRYNFMFIFNVDFCYFLYTLSICKA